MPAPEARLCPGASPPSLASASAGVGPTHAHKGASKERLGWEFQPGPGCLCPFTSCFQGVAKLTSMNVVRLKEGLCLPHLAV